MKYQIISSDGHMDPETLPPDTFTARMAKSLGDLVPHVVEANDGPNWVSGDTLLGPWGPRSFAAHAHTRRGQAMLAGGYDPEGCRPSNVELRRKDQETDGVDAEVIYGPFRRWSYLDQLSSELGAATVAAYNEYVAEFGAESEGRHFGLGATPLGSPEDTVSELEHIRGLGLVGAEVSFNAAVPPLWDSYWEPIFEAAGELSCPLHFHAGFHLANLRLDSALNWETPALAVALSTVGMTLNSVLGSVILSGALDRYPKLKVVMAESGIGWIPYLIDRLDNEWENNPALWSAFSPSRPSELFRRQVYATFQEDVIGCQLAALYPENFLWGADYPHGDGVWPDSQEVIAHTMGTIDESVRTRLLRDNASALYAIE